MTNPVEELLQSLLAGDSYEVAIEKSGFTQKQADDYLRANYPDLLKALKSKPVVKSDSLVISKITKEGQLLTPRPVWYTGQENNKHVPLAHVVLLPTIRVTDGPGHLTRVPPGYVVRHIDGDKSNVSLSNLELTSRSNAARERNNARVRLDSPES